jgi:tRNA dimethylallyltransferase
MQTRPVEQIALIGATASGKSSLALKLAQRYNGFILSLDSLALYRRIDIASAKPSREELASVPHFGIDILDPDQPFDVTRFIDLYREVHTLAKQEGRPLFIVGGSSFYLKVLLEGISPLPPIDEEVRKRVATLLHTPEEAYRLLHSSAPDYAATLAPTDRYRIEKALLIFLQTGEDPRDYFRKHPPVPIIADPLPLFEILHERAVLRQRIVLRTKQMLRNGLVDEVAALEARYGRSPNPMKAIGIKEVLDYFDGRLSYDEMREKIIIHTARLAKRQRTFNEGQFDLVVRGDAKFLEREIEKILEGL